MKKILAAIFMMLVPAVTQAADFATTRASVIEGSANPIALWTGLYLGAQLGVLTDKSSTTCTTGQNCSLDIVWENTANTQFSGGIYAGYNVQFGRGVVGIEADANMNNGTASMSYASGINATSYGYVIHSDYSASVRARAGFLMTDRLLAYGTGGVAFTNFKIDNPSCPNCGGWQPVVVTDNARVGYVVGAGLEYALDRNVHLKLEYLYSDFGSKLYTPSGMSTKLST